MRLVSRLANWSVILAVMCVCASGSVNAAPKRLNPDTTTTSDGRVFDVSSETSPSSSSKTEGGTPEYRGDQPEDSEPEPTRIIINNRYKVNDTTQYPYRATVHIAFNDGNWCTGFLYKTNMVATAGHCVHTGGASGSWKGIDYVAAGKQGSTEPYGRCGATMLYSVAGWTVDRNKLYDYGAIRLNCSIGNTVGTYGLFFTTTDSYFQDRWVNLPGYHGDKNRELWTSSGQIKQVAAREFYYNNDMMGGASGAPVYEVRPIGSASCSGVCAEAINANEYDPPTLNSGTRITQEVFTNLINWSK